VRDFYAALTGSASGGVIDVPRAAFALHEATCLLRERYPDWPTLWAGHTHVGP
jgi:hypothetical protein